MAKKTRDEIRQELNEYLAEVKEKLAQLNADHNAAKTNLENSRTNYENLIIKFNNDKDNRYEKIFFVGSIVHASECRSSFFGRFRH